MDLLKEATATAKALSASAAFFEEEEYRELNDKLKRYLQSSADGVVL